MHWNTQKISQEDFHDFEAIDLGIQLLDSGVLFHQEAVQEKNEEKLVLYASPIKFKRKKDARDGFNQI